MNFSLLVAAVTSLSGIVTFEREGLDFCFLQDESGTNWRIALKDDSKVRIGDWLQVSGEREVSVKPRLANTTVKVVRHDESSVPPARPVTISQLFKNIMPIGNPKWYGGVFVTEGLVRDINRRHQTTQILVGENENTLMVELPIAIDESLPSRLIPGATVQIEGALAYTSIENVDAEIFGRIEDVELLINSMDSVKIVKRAPFWTPQRYLALFIGFCVLLVVIAAWAMTLKRMVNRRTRELGESIRQREIVRIEADASRRERLRLAADLHDGFQQYLAGAAFRLQAAINKMPKDAQDSREQLEKAKLALQYTQNGLRSMLWAMNAESEGPESLTELFTFVCRRLAHWEGVVEIKSEGEERKVARKSAGTLLLVFQEAVGNAIRHGHATKVSVLIRYADKRLEVCVSDNGCGFDVDLASATSGHYGIASMQRRVSELGGELKISSRNGEGAEVRFAIPLV